MGRIYWAWERDEYEEDMQEKQRQRQIAAMRAATPMEGQMFASYGYSPQPTTSKEQGQGQGFTTKDWYKNLIASLQRLRR